MLLLVPTLFTGPLARAADEAPSFERAWPRLPEDGAVTDARPVFRIAFSGVEPERAREMRFRIDCAAESRDDGRLVDRVWDQRQWRSGWAVSAPDEVLFRPPTPLEDGEWTWSVSAWNGVDWIPAGSPRRIRVDTVPPGDVEGLRVELDRETGGLRLRWWPVTADQEGAAEYVTRYHVYRFEAGPDQRVARLFEIGTTEFPLFIDADPPTDRAIVFYRIAAEDQAGNVPGLRR